MNTTRHTPIQWPVVAIGWPLMALVLIGCGKRQQIAKPVDPEQARQVLQAVLTDWSQGGKPESWQHKSPQVVVQDFDWAGGAKLNRFEVLGNGEARDANLFCRVKLMLEDTSRGPMERTVTYCVGTDPVLTIFRAMEP